MPAAEYRGLDVAIELRVRPPARRVERGADERGERGGRGEVVEDEAEGLAEDADLCRCSYQRR